MGSLFDRLKSSRNSQYDELRARYSGVLDDLAEAETEIIDKRIVPFAKDSPGDDPILTYGFRATLLRNSVYIDNSVNVNWVRGRLEEIVGVREEIVGGLLEKKAGIQPDLGKNAVNTVMYFLLAPWSKPRKNHGKNQYCLLISGRTNDLRYRKACFRATGLLEKAKKLIALKYPSKGIDPKSHLLHWFNDNFSARDLLGSSFGELLKFEKIDFSIKG